jgi:PAS domain-containing protein
VISDGHDGYHSEEDDASTPNEAGIYSWIIESNTLYGDSLIADLYGFDPGEAAAGLPLETYLGRLHDEDQPEIKRLIKKAVLDGKPYHAEHRVRNAEGAFRWVISMGRCFRDQNAMPLIFSGIMYPIDQLSEQMIEHVDGHHLERLRNCRPHHPGQCSPALLAPPSPYPASEAHCLVS